MLFLPVKANVYRFSSADWLDEGQITALFSRISSDIKKGKKKGKKEESTTEEIEENANYLRSVDENQDLDEIQEELAMERETSIENGPDADNHPITVTPFLCQISNHNFMSYSYRLGLSTFVVLLLASSKKARKLLRS